MQLPHSKLFQRNNQRLIATSKKKAVIVNYNALASLADIYFLDNPQTIVKNVPISNSVQTYLQGSLIVNKNCVVDIFDESNSSQMIVAYTY